MKINFNLLEKITESMELDDKYETVMIESKIREGFVHKVVKDIETGKAISCSCKCWSKGNKPCVGMRTVGFDI